MKEIDVYVHTCEGTDPRLIKIAEDAAVEELLERLRTAGVVLGEPGEEVLLFIENGDEAVGRGRKLSDCGIRHRHHLHCHRCRHIRVAAFYNGVEKSASFSPSAKVGRVLKWAVAAFELKGVDADNKGLYLKDSPNVELLNDAHIGSFAKFPGCEVKVCLAPIIRVQG